ncbi:GNAT family N-acetyltransferase [Peribacillus alkalitolerans]|uniref:GNAT family N-acetyltransferase n=1 Tax=Peribacillus alkalitolerans TaxID=1550385 RepID=UPI001968687D|nr:GNAT family protein [Peribacillus alkalitolerans]
MNISTTKKINFPVLHTERFILRKIEESDAQEIFEYFSKDEVTKYYDLESFTNIEQAIELIKRWDKRFEDHQGYRWGIALKESNQLIGSCGYHNWSKEHFKAEIGYEVTPAYWRRGVITEVLEKVLQYGFDEMGLFRIEAYYDPENIASKGSLEKAGFIYEGTLRKSAFEKGRFCDAAVCSILKGEFKREKYKYQKALF